MVITIVGLNPYWSKPSGMPTFRNVLPPTYDARSGRAIILTALVVRGRARQIIFLRVLSHCAVGRVLRRQSRHALTHAFNPCDGKPVCVAVVEERNDLLLQFRVERVGLGSIPLRILTSFSPVAYGPTHILRVSLGPPTIQLRQVKAAVR